MNNIFLILAALLISPISMAKETWVVKEMPEVKYLYRTVIGKPDGAKAAATAKELVDEAKKLNLVFSKTVFYKLDLEKKVSTEAGLEVSGPNLAKVPANLLRARLGGKYLIGHYTGKETRKLYKSLIPTYQAKKLVAKDSSAYMYSKNAGTDNATLILVLPLK